MVIFHSFLYVYQRIDWSITHWTSHIFFLTLRREAQHAVRVNLPDQLVVGMKWCLHPAFALLRRDSQICVIMLCRKTALYMQRMVINSTASRNPKNRRPLHPNRIIANREVELHISIQPHRRNAQKGSDQFNSIPDHLLHGLYSNPKTHREVKILLT